MILVTYHTETGLPDREYKDTKQFFEFRCYSNKEATLRSGFLINDKVYKLPTNLGNEPICALCKRQLDCLSGVKKLAFEPVEEL